MPARSDSTWKKFFSSRWFVIVGGAVLLLLIFGYSRALYQDYQIRQEIRRLQCEALRLQVKRSETLEALGYVRSPAYIEEKARTELNLMRPGEKMAIVNGSTSAPAPSRQPTEKMVESKNISNPLKWWYYFFGNPTANE